MKNLIDKIINPNMWKVFGDFPHEKGKFCRDLNKIKYETSTFSVETKYIEDDCR